MKQNKIEAVIIISLLVLFFLVSRGFNISPVFASWWSDIAWTIASGAVSWRALQVAQVCHGNARKGWLLIAAANIAWLFGMLIWDYYELILGEPTPYPGLPDIGYLLFALLMILGLYQLRPNAYYQRFYSMLQFGKLGIVVISLLISHMFFLNVPLDKIDSGTLYKITSLAYPVIYISSFLFSASIFWRKDNPVNNPVNNPVVNYLLLGLAVHTIAASFYAYSLLGQNYQTGNYIDILWLIAFALTYWATSIHLRNIKRSNENIKSTENSLINFNFDIFLPVLGLALLGYSVFSTHSDVTPDLLADIFPFFLLLILFIGLREWANQKFESVLKNERRVAEEKVMILNRELEQRVGERTKELLYSETHYRTLINNVIDSVITINNKGIIKSINPATERLFGYSAIELIGQNIKALMPEPYQSEHDNYISRYRDTKVKKIIGLGREVKGLKKDGTIFNLGLGVSEMKLEGEQLFIGIIRDVTERVEAEQQLKDAMHQAESANKAKSKFLSSMSHELRTPLTAIIGFGQLLEMDAKDENTKDNVGEITRAGYHLLELINDILDLSSIESGELPLSIKDVLLKDVFIESLSLIKPLAENRDISVISPSSQCTDCHVRADYMRLKQVLLNLLSNAVKYNRQGGSITISCEPCPDNKMRISVTDTGMGMSASQLEQLFQEFNRVGAEQTDIEGTGIGLVITKRLVELMSGNIGVESQQGKGTSFWVELNLSEHAEHLGIKEKQQLS